MNKLIELNQTEVGHVSGGGIIMTVSVVTWVTLGVIMLCCDRNDDVRHFPGGRPGVIAAYMGAGLYFGYLLENGLLF